MPSIVGKININSNSGTVNIGDTLAISPKSNTKSISGQGGGNNGNVINTLNGGNLNNVADPNGVDQTIVGSV